MHCYESKFQLLPTSFEIPTMNLLTFITRFVCGNKEKGHPHLWFRRIVDLKNAVSGTRNKARCQVVKDTKLLMKNV